MHPNGPEPGAAVGRTTQLFRRLGAGDGSVADELLSAVYDELRSLARACMARERAEHTLQPTALVHEAWLRIVGDDAPRFVDRAHFVGIAGRAMRRVLVDHARRRDADKRGGAAAEREPLDEALIAFESRAFDLLTLSEALERLEALDPQLVRIVEQRFFAGASNAEIAASLGVSERTVERGWSTARAWLRSQLEPGGSRS